MNRNNKGVSEVIGTALLLAIAVTAFSSVYVYVLSDPGPPPDSLVTVIGKLGVGEVIFEHYGGQAINIDSKVLFTIAGVEQIPIPIERLLNDESKRDGFWNIGEQLIYLNKNITDFNLDVNAIIVDKKSNSAILWGTLQEGFVLSSHGKGGIWHFNETFWDGTQDEVKDSSGNYNHGTAHSGAITSTQKNIIDDGSIAGENAGFFNGYSSYIEVGDHPSLHITKNITVQAWLKPMAMDPVISTADLGEAFAFNPDVVHVTDGIYAVAARGQKKHEGVIVTFEIKPNGSLTSGGIFNNKYIFDPIWGEEPDLIRVEGSENVFAIAYRSKIGDSHLGILKTLTILPNGTIPQEYINMTEFDTSNAWEPKIIHVSGNKYAIAYAGGAKNSSDAPGILKTITILPDGNISSISSPEYFHDSFGVEPDIIHISGDLYTIVYRTEKKGKDNPGKLVSVNIDNGGNIGTFSLPFPVDNVCFEPNMVLVSNISKNILAITYRGSSFNGCIKSFEILPTEEKIEMDYFEITKSNKCYNPRIIHANLTTYGLTYATDGSGAPKGELITIQIDNSTGRIKNETLLTEHIGESKFFEPDIIHAFDNIYIIAYRTGSKNPQEGGPPHHGKITAIIIDEDTTPPHMRGIVKGGAAQIYANLTHVYASINGPDNELTITPITPNIWYHVVLTYDGKTIRLYCNEKNADILYSEHRSYSGLINEKGNSLRFGHKFSGLIDEIYIFDYALTPEQINHYNNPST